jgi:dihydrofolate reductase
MKAILACDPRGGIGYQNRLPWPFLNGDLKRFKELTSNQVIVMGRNTWKSLPKKPLPHRLNIVVSSQKLELPPGAICVNSLDHFSVFKDAWIIGGNKLLLSAWDLIDEIHLSITSTEYTCDTFIDLVKLKNEFKVYGASGHGDHVYEIWKREP